MRPALFLLGGALGCSSLPTATSATQTEVAPASSETPAFPGEPVPSSTLYELLFQEIGHPPSGMGIMPDGRVLTTRPDGTWELSFVLDATQLSAIRAVLDATDVVALNRLSPPEGERSHPPPSADLRFVRRGVPVVVRVPLYTPQGAPAIEALHQQVQATWAGAPMSSVVWLGTEEVRLPCDPTAALSLRDVLFPLLDPKLPDAPPSSAPPLLAVEWWQGGTFVQRYDLRPGGIVSRTVPGRADAWKQLDEAVGEDIEARVARLSPAGLRAGCP